MKTIVTEYTQIGERNRVQHHSMKPFGLIEEAVYAVLETVQSDDGYTAREYLEWIMMYRDDLERTARPDDLFPRMGARDMIHITVQRGPCEGWHIKFLLCDPDTGRYSTPITLKYLSNPDLVFRAAKALAEAVDAGSYETELPPEEVAA